VEFWVYATLHHSTTPALQFFSPLQGLEQFDLRPALEVLDPFLEKGLVLETHEHVAVELLFFFELVPVNILFAFPSNDKHAFVILEDGVGITLVFAQAEGRLLEFLKVPDLRDRVLPAYELRGFGLNAAFLGQRRPVFPFFQFLELSFSRGFGRLVREEKDILLFHFVFDLVKGGEAGGFLVFHLEHVEFPSRVHEIAGFVALH